MKYMKILEKDIKQMVLECLKGVINEITSRDAYQRFYKDKIQVDIWEKLMTGVTNMTPFHKKMADTIIIAGDVTSQFELASDAQEAWSKGPVVQQFLVNIAKEKGYDVLSSPGRAHEFLQNVLSSSVNGVDKRTREEFLDGSLVKIYEDNELLVTCTLSYTASHKYYNDSKWCTASGIDGEYSGYRMFTGYTVSDNKVLFQFVDKNDRRNTYQAAIGNPTEIGQVCDFDDNGVDFQNVLTQFGKEKIRKILNSVDYDNLLSLTTQYANAEKTYYEYEEWKFIEKARKHFAQKVSSEECKTLTIECLMEYIEKGFRENTYTPFFYYSKDGRYQNYIHNVAAYNIYYYAPDRDNLGDLFTEAELRALRRLTSQYQSMGMATVLLKNDEVMAFFPQCRFRGTSGVLGKMEVDGNETNLIIFNMADGKIIGNFPGCYCVTAVGFVRGGWNIAYYGEEFVGKMLIAKAENGNRVVKAVADPVQGTIEKCNMVFTRDDYDGDGEWKRIN